MIRDIDKEIDALEKELDSLAAEEDSEIKQLRTTQIKRNRDELLATLKNLSAEDKVYMARHPKRPNVTDYISEIFDDFFEVKGDHLCREDASILGGIAMFHGNPVTVIGHRKGTNLEENMKYNFGMPSPEGYRKALRLMKQAEKFGRPIITFIDTPGAYPGLEAEARGQSEAIARNLAEMSLLKVPVISVVTGEGSSGGALALGVANSVLMLENAVYSILSPEGFATILWKDASRSGEASEMMKLTAEDLYKFDIIEKIIPEPAGGAHRNRKFVFRAVDSAITAELVKMSKMNGAALAAARYKKFRMIGSGGFPTAPKEEV